MTKSNEEKYFFDLNQKLIRKRRKDLDVQRQELREKEIQEQHWMCCPKCGHTMEETNISGIIIDCCPNCFGMYADKGELELIMESKKSGKFLNALQKHFDNESEKSKKK